MEISVFEIFQYYNFPIKKIGSTYRSNICPACGENSQKSHKVIISEKHWYCFRCGEQGNVYEFIKQAERVDFKQACKILDRIAGNDYKPSRKIIKITDYKEKEKKELEKELQLKQQLIKQVLKQSIITSNYKKTKGFQYLLDRGIPEKIINQYLNQRIFIINPERVLNNGKLIKLAKEAGLKGLKWLTNREIVFPFYDFTGKGVGAEFRSIEKNSNFPKTISLGKKFSQLWEDGKYKNILLAEGFIDALSARGLNWNGHILVVPGTSHAKEAAELLKRKRYKKIYAAFDPDEAGIIAAQKAKEILKGIKSLKLPQKKDLNDILKSGLDNLETFIPKSFWERLWEKVKEIA